MKCHYEVFELPRTATLDDIKKQYKRLALKWHPDKNVGNETQATENFKAITAAYAVLSDAQERKWYDDHRESILRGGDGISSEGGLDSPLINLWKYFNATCFSGFHDGPGGFYQVYGDLFAEIHNIDFRDIPDTAPMNISIGDAASSDAEISLFYGHWTNFVTVLSFSWEDKYNILDAPNRFVKRAMEKDNKKFREAARKKYIETVRALAEYVRKRDVRVLRMETERKKKAAQEATEREEKRRAEKEKRRLDRERWKDMCENDEEEAEQRAVERSRAFLLAEEPRGRRLMKMKPAGGGMSVFRGDDDDDENAEAYGVGDLSMEDGGADDNIVDDAEDEDDDIEIMRCELCRKDFKTIAQLDQHLSSKVHRKKAQEAAKKVKKEAPTAKGKRSLSAATAAAAPAPQSTELKMAQAVDGYDDVSAQTAELTGEESDTARKSHLTGRQSCKAHKPSSKKASTTETQCDSSSENDSDDSGSDSSVDITKLSSFAQSSTVKQGGASTDSDCSSSESEGNSTDDSNSDRGGGDEEQLRISSDVPMQKQEPAVDVQMQQSVRAAAGTETLTSAPIASVFTKCEVITPSGGDCEEYSDYARNNDVESLRCKICGYEAMSRNKLFQHVKATGHAAYKDATGEPQEPVGKKSKKKKGGVGAPASGKKKGNRKGNY